VTGFISAAKRQILRLGSKFHEPQKTADPNCSYWHLYIYPIINIGRMCCT